MNTFYAVQYTGEFGFIRPINSVRDIEIHSQKFLTPSILKGIEQYLFPDCIGNTQLTKIIRHKLYFDSYINEELERTTAIQVNKSGSKKTSIIIRGLLTNPVLTLLFNSYESAKLASTQIIKLTRNEDLLLPKLIQISIEDFNMLEGNEYTESDECNGIFVGYDRFDNFKKSYITLNF